MDESGTKWDVFISYASEDRSEVAGPLAELLSALGVKVWYDRTELKVGDSLRQSIDEGLSQCRYGVVILSKAFFLKHYPKRELDGLAQREVDGQTVILPVWSGVTESEVRSFSPPLAGRIAARWENGLIPVMLEILEVARPDLLKTIENSIADTRALPELCSGKELIAVVDGALAFDFSNEELSDEVELDLVGGFLQQLQDWGDLVGDFDVSERLRAEFHVSEALKALAATGWKIFGCKENRQVKAAGKADDWPVAVIVVARSNALSVIRLPGGDFAVTRRTQQGPPITPARTGEGSGDGETP